MENEEQREYHDGGPSPMIERLSPLSLAAVASTVRMTVRELLSWQGYEPCSKRPQEN